MARDLEYYNRFPGLLKNALIKGKVIFPDTLICEYSDMEVYRAVSYTKEKTRIDKSDFASKMELKLNNPMVVAFEDEVTSYSCSCFLNMEQMRIHAKFPRRNKAIAKGIIKKEYGPIDKNNDTSHVDSYLFEDVDPSDGFEVIEKWEKNGLV